MHHGSRLTVGDAVLRLRLFVGLETAHPTAASSPRSRRKFPRRKRHRPPWTGRICRISIIRFPPHGWTRRDNTSPFKWPERH